MTGVILAGGQGVRIGGDKPQVKLGGRPLLQWAVDAMQHAVPRIVIAVAPGQQLPSLKSRVPVGVCEDLLPGRGPLSGIYTALRCADAGHVLAIPCDAPLIAPELLRLLLERRNGFDAVIPEAGGRLQTAIGVYARSSIHAMTEVLNSDDRSVRALLQRLDVNVVAEAEVRTADPELRSFVNVNTPQELDAVEALLSPARARRA